MAEGAEGAAVEGAAVKDSAVKGGVGGNGLADGGPMVVAENLVRLFPGPAGGDPVRAVDDVSIAIRRGETFGLVGESGSGKSTVSRLLLGLDRPTSGRVIVDGAEVSALSERRLRPLRQRMQMVFQDPHASLNRRKTVEQIIGLPLAVHTGLSARARAERVRELLDLVGLRPEFAARYPHEMSGGQCQRVGIARAIALEPELVVLDEAVSAVDVSIQAQILNLLKDLQRRLGLTYVFVSHDLALVRYMSDRIAVLYRGRVVELAERDDLFASPRHPYTAALLAAVPEADPSRRRGVPVLPATVEQEPSGTGCRYRGRCPRAGDEPLCRDQEPDLLGHAGSGHLIACHLNERSAGAAATRSRT
jgi:oligopeptide/dipeptide ABC transporter ATP-binding protein